MSRYHFELADPGDDADLRRVLAQTPMPGGIAVSFRREPSYFDAAVVDGRFRQVIACRETASGRIIGFGSRSVGQRRINGKPAPVGYLSALRLLPEHRNRGLVARGYAYFRKLHADGRAPVYVTTIAEGNTAARMLLTSGRAGLPAYHDAGRYHTVALSLGGRHRRWSAPAGLEIRPARVEDVPEIVRFLAEEGSRRQFFPCYVTEDFFTPRGAFRDLRPADLLLALRGERLVGTLGAWDQRGFRQVVVNGYGPGLRWGRALYNGLARLRGSPRLPAPGEALAHLMAALPVVAGDDAEVFAALLGEMLARASRGDAEYLMLGLHETDPLLPVVRSYRATWYTTRLYLVCWEDGDGLRSALDGRPPHLELGSL